MSLQRMLPFLLLNILVSAAFVIGIWTFLDRRQTTACTACDTEVALTPLDSLEADVSVGQGPELVLPTDNQGAVAEVVQPTAVPAGPTVHTVVAGEVLSAIAAQYDVSMQEIVDENALADVNSIFVGQQLVIPDDEAVAAPVADPAAAANAIEEISPQPVPTAEVIVGASTFEISSVSGAGDISAEQLLLVNVGPNTAFLQGWTISNDAGNTFTFGDVALFGNGAGITIHTGPGDNTPTDIYWNITNAAWQSGQVLVLRDADGNIQAQITVP